MRAGYAIVAMFQMDREDILEATAGSPLNTDDNMRIEYNAPLNLHRDTHDENMLFMLRNAAVPENAVSSAEEWARLAEAYEERGDSGRAMVAYQVAIERAGSEVQKGAYTESLRDIVERIKKAARDEEDE